MLAYVGIMILLSFASLLVVADAFGQPWEVRLWQVATGKTVNRWREL
jgi:hypothetical protein